MKKQKSPLYFVNLVCFDESSSLMKATRFLLLMNIPLIGGTDEEGGEDDEDGDK